jgi:ribonuclease E
MDDTAPGAPDLGDADAAPRPIPADPGLAPVTAESETTESGELGPDGEPRPAAKKRRRGSRGGKGRKKPVGAGEIDDDGDDLEGDDETADAAGAETDAAPAPRAPRARTPRPAPEAGDAAAGSADDDTPTPQRQRAPRVPKTTATPAEGAGENPELPERIGEGRPSPEAAETALVRKPRIGDTRPAPAAAPPAAAPAVKQGGKGRARTAGAGAAGAPAAAAAEGDGERTGAKKRRRGGKGRSGAVVTAQRPTPIEVDPDVLEKRRGRERNGRPVGRYLMAVQVRPTLTQVAVLEGRNLIEHYVSRPADDISQIHGNIYLGKVQNVLPGMEAAFVDIGTPKNAVLYRGDVQYDAEDIVEKSNNLRIEQMLRAKQLIICQVTKNPIGAKGARLTQEVSLPGRFVVLIPNSKTYGISKRLPDDVRKRLRNILDRVKPAEHGLIVRTAAENATEHELRADMTRLLDQWNAIEAKAKKAQGPTLLYREPELAVRVIREEFNAEYRGVIIDDRRLYDDVKDYVSAFNPELADRIEFHDPNSGDLPLFEVHHIHEQLHKALDRKVWLPSGGSLIIEHTEALTVIDVNTGKNVGTTNLEETVFRNNLEAAEEVAKQLRLRDIGGIVVIDFIDMEIRDNRKKVVEAFRSALARDKTRTQVFDISELGLVEMTRKRIGEGLLTNFADQCPTCAGRGVVIDHALLG